MQPPKELRHLALADPAVQLGGQRSLNGGQISAAVGGLTQPVLALGKGELAAVARIDDAHLTLAGDGIVIDQPQIGPQTGPPVRRGRLAGGCL